VNHGYGVRTLFGLCLEQLVNATGLRVSAIGVIEIDDHLLTFRF
jgi:hypothetical protein